MNSFLSKELSKGIRHKKHYLITIIIIILSIIYNDNILNSETENTDDIPMNLPMLPVPETSIPEITYSSQFSGSGDDVGVSYYRYRKLIYIEFYGDCCLLSRILYYNDDGTKQKMEFLDENCMVNSILVYENNIKILRYYYKDDYISKIAWYNENGLQYFERNYNIDGDVINQNFILQE